MATCARVPSWTRGSARLHASDIGNVDKCVQSAPSTGRRETCAGGGDRARPGAPASRRPGSAHRSGREGPVDRRGVRIGLSGDFASAAFARRRGSGKGKGGGNQSRGSPISARVGRKRQGRRPKWAGSWPGRCIPHGRGAFRHCCRQRHSRPDAGRLGAREDP
jgi:hypothetical protein